MSYNMDLIRPCNLNSFSIFFIEKCSWHVTITYPLKVTGIWITFDFAASKFVPFFGRPGFVRSPTPPFILPPSADAMARAMAMQDSPEQRRSHVVHDQRVSVYIDNEALQSESGNTRTIDLMNSDSSGESYISS
jgi:hypothetical protein